MAAPTLVRSILVNHTSSDTSTLTSGAFTPTAGNILVVKAVTADAGLTAATPTSVWTYTLRASSTAASHTGGWIWTAPVTASTSTNVSVAFSGTTVPHSILVEEWSGAQLAATPAKNTTQTGTGAPSATLTTVANNSIVTCLDGDWAAVAPGTPAYRSSALEDNGGAPNGHFTVSGQYTCFFFYQTAATAGSQTIGLTAPGGQTWTMLGIEIEAASAGGVTGDVATTVTLTGAADSVLGASTGAASTLNLTATALGVVGLSTAAAATLTLAGAAVGAAGVSQGAAATIVLTGAAAGARGLFTGATSTLTLTATATGVVGTSTGASTTLSLTGSGTGSTVLTTGAAATLTLTGAAAGTVSAGLSTTAAATLVVTGAAAGVVALNTGAAATVALTAAASGVVGLSTGAASTLTLTGAAASGSSGIQPIASTNGNSTSAAPVITFPTGYGASDALILFLSRNQTSTSFTASSEVTSITALSNANTGRLAAFLVIPNGTGHASFTLTTSASAVNGWWLADYGTGYDLAATVNHAENAVGNSTSSGIAPPEVQLGYIATGNEVAFSAAGVNSTATWTTDSNTVYFSTTGNAALMVDAQRPTATELTQLYATMDRGNNGSSRNQQGLGFVLQADPLGTVNLLSNPSFETNGGTIATGWNEEHSVTGTPTYSSTASGVVDGTIAQQVVYAGQAGDDGTKTLEIYQAPIPILAGQTLTFNVWLSGSVNTDAIIGIESFDASNVYISEQDTGIPPNTLTGTPTLFTVTYVCPLNADHVAVYYQVDDIGSSTSVTAILDKATLVVASAITGAASQTLTFAAATAGVVGATTGATQTATLTCTASGVVGTASPVSGTVTLSTSAAGVVGASTGASGTLTLTATAAGVVTSGLSGTATTTVALTGAASGVYGRTGTTPATLALTAAAAGVVGLSTTASTTVTLSGSAVGAAGKSQTATAATLTLVAVAAGHVSTVVAVPPITVTGSTSAVVGVAGSSTPAITVSGSTSALITVT